MKLGSENPKKIVITAGLAIFALGLFGFMVLSGSGSGTAPSHAGVDQREVIGRTQASESFDPSLRTDLLKASEDVAYTGTGLNLFAVKSDSPKPPKPTCAPRGGPSHELPWCNEMIVPNRQKAAIPLKFFGFANRTGEPKKAFLSHDQDIFIAQEGDIVDRRYRIVRITPTSVDIQDVLDEDMQTIGLTT